MKFLVCLFLFFILSVSPVLAYPDFGPNIAANINTANFDEIREAYGQSVNWVPVTIMVSPADLEDAAKMRELIDSAAKNQIELTLRIYSGGQDANGNWDPLTTQDAVSSAQNISRIYGLFPANHKPQVEIGNELNSNWEWGGKISAAETGEMLSAFLNNANFPVMLPALNMFPGKDPNTGQETSDYKTFLQEMVRNNPDIVNHPNLQMFAFNTYGDNAQQAADKWLEEKSFLQEIGFNLSGKQFILTEAGPNPSLNMSLDDTEKFLTDMFNIFKNDPEKYARLLNVTALIFDEDGNALLASLDANGKIVLNKLASFGGSISRGAKKPLDKDCRAGCCPLPQTKIGSTNFISDPVNKVEAKVLVPRRTACQKDDYKIDIQEAIGKLPLFGPIYNYLNNRSYKKPGPETLYPSALADNQCEDSLKEIIRLKQYRYAYDEAAKIMGQTPEAALSTYKTYKDDREKAKDFFQKVWPKCPLAPNHQIAWETTVKNQDGAATYKSAVSNVTAVNSLASRLQKTMYPAALTANKPANPQVLGEQTGQLQFSTEIINPSFSGNNLDLNYSVSVQGDPKCSMGDAFFEVNIFVGEEQAPRYTQSSFYASFDPQNNQGKVLEPGWGNQTGDLQFSKEEVAKGLRVEPRLVSGNQSEGCSKDIVSPSCSVLVDAATGQLKTTCAVVQPPQTCNDQNKEAPRPPAARPPSVPGDLTTCSLGQKLSGFLNSASNPQEPDSSCITNENGTQTCTETQSADVFNRNKYFEVFTKTGASLNTPLLSFKNALSSLVPSSLQKIIKFNQKEPVKGQETVNAKATSLKPNLTFPNGGNASVDNGTAALPIQAGEDGIAASSSLLPAALQL